MMKTNKVLIPLDNSEFSLNVLPHVTRILQPDSNALYLFHVEPEPDVIRVDDQIMVYADQAAATLKAECLATIQPYARKLEKLGYQVTPVVVFGDPATEIERYVEEKGMDMVAMATHGRTGIARVLHGSVAQQVFANIDVPVLLYRAPTIEDEDDDALDI